MTPTIAPVKNAKYNATIILGKPRTRPIKNENFISPSPIPLPPVARERIRKKINAPKADKIWEIKNSELRIKNKNETRIAGKTILSGIIPYFKSAKKTIIRHDKINK